MGVSYVEADKEGILASRKVSIKDLLGPPQPQESMIQMAKALVPIYLFIYLFIYVFLGSHLQHMDVLRVGVQSEL